MTKIFVPQPIPLAAETRLPPVLTPEGYGDAPIDDERIWYLFYSVTTSALGTDQVFIFSRSET